MFPPLPKLQHKRRLSSTPDKTFLIMVFLGRVGSSRMTAGRAKIGRIWQRNFGRRTGELNGSLSGSGRLTLLPTDYGKRSIFGRKSPHIEKNGLLSA
jgi:hypothetical protein